MHRVRGFSVDCNRITLCSKSKLYIDHRSLESERILRYFAISTMSMPFTTGDRYIISKPRKTAAKRFFAPLPRKEERTDCWPLPNDLFAVPDQYKCYCIAWIPLNVELWWKELCISLKNIDQKCRYRYSNCQSNSYWIIAHTHDKRSFPPPTSPHIIIIE